MSPPFPAYQGSDPFIFVSYRHADSEVVYAELEWLNACGFNVWFDEGITPGEITGLQAFQSFPIIAPSSTFKYKGTSPDIREVAVELGAGYIIDGSVRKIADDVHITVKLNNAQGQLVLAENYDFKYEDVLRMQAELVGKIMLAIEPELLISEADRARFVRTEDMEAFDYFLRASANTFVPFGYTDLNGRAVTPERLDLAREYALKAVELDPGFAAGWRMLNHIDGAYALNQAYKLTKQEFAAKIERSIEYGERSRPHLSRRCVPASRPCCWQTVRLSRPGYFRKNRSSKTQATQPYMR